jgi:hypothetical protein
MNTKESNYLFNEQSEKRLFANQALLFRWSTVGKKENFN